MLPVACSAPATSHAPSAAPSASSAPPSIASLAPTATSASPSSESSEAPVELAWAPLTPSAAPPAREDHTWTVDPAGDVAYLFGGRDGSSAFGDVWAYDLASDAWSEVATAPGPAARFGHEAVWVESVGLVIFGGQAGTAFFNDLWAFDPASAAWTRLEASGDVPVARYGTCAGIGPDGRLWISHGFTADQERFADTVAYDFATGQWTDETPADGVPVRRCLHGCWWTESGELALFGGQATGVLALGDLWLMTDGGWRQVETTLPAARNLYARARVPPGTLVFGGQAVDEAYLADLHLIDDTGEATPLSPSGEPPPGRAGSELVVDEERGRVLLFGGRDADRAYADLWELSGPLPPG